MNSGVRAFLAGLARGIAASLLLAAPAAAAKHPSPAPAPTRTPLPCTAIPVVLVDTLDTGKLHPGDVFRFRTVDTIVAPGRVTIPGNAVGYGVVALASAAGPHGKSGSLVVEARYVDLGRGRSYPVMIDAVSSAAVSQTGPSGNVASGVGSLPLPFVGTAVGAFNYLHAGKNAVIRPGLRFIVIPAGNLARGMGCSL